MEVPLVMGVGLQAEAQKATEEVILTDHLDKAVMDKMTMMTMTVMIKRLMKIMKVAKMTTMMIMEGLDYLKIFKLNLL
jgi:hypothetical protein